MAEIIDEHPYLRSDGEPVDTEEDTEEDSSDDDDEIEYHLSKKDPSKHGNKDEKPKAETTQKKTTKEVNAEPKKIDAKEVNAEPKKDSFAKRLEELEERLNEEKVLRIKLEEQVKLLEENSTQAQSQRNQLLNWIKQLGGWVKDVDHRLKIVEQIKMYFK